MDKCNRKGGCSQNSIPFATISLVPSCLDPIWVQKLVHLAKKASQMGPRGSPFLDTSFQIGIKTPQNILTIKESEAKVLALHHNHALTYCLHDNHQLKYLI